MNRVSKISTTLVTLGAMASSAIVFLGSAQARPISCDQVNRGDLERVGGMKIDGWENKSVANGVSQCLFGTFMVSISAPHKGTGPMGPYPSAQGCMQTVVTREGQSIMINGYSCPQVSKISQYLLNRANSNS